MKVRLWGTRGSQASPGPDTMRYGGNTSCVQVMTDERTLLVLDAGTGLRRLAAVAGREVERIDILLTHLHMDHIQGLGFFSPLHQRGLDVHVWGPASTTLDLRSRLSRYLSPPLFPVRLRDLACDLHLHDVPAEAVKIPGVSVTAELVCHPGPTVGYRLERDGRVLTYLPDHEPRLGSHGFAHHPDWTSGFALARASDLLIHDAQYTDDEYRVRCGWGHSTLADAIAFGSMCEVRSLLLFHHDPGHDDQLLDRLVDEARSCAGPDLDVIAAREDLVLQV